MFGKTPDNSKLLAHYIGLQEELGQVLLETKGKTYEEKIVTLIRKNRAVADALLSFDNYIKRLNLPAQSLIQELPLDSSKIIDINRIAPDFIERYQVMVKTMGMM